jgi:hypothetical protein
MRELEASKEKTVDDEDEDEAEGPYIYTDDFTSLLANKPQISGTKAAVD